MKYLILDFNGTVLNDVQLSLYCINRTAERYLDRDIITLEEYKRVFCFPVKAYYEALGFDFDELDWYEVGKYWMDTYTAKRKEAKLFDGVYELLIKNREMGNKNILLNASRKDLLIEQIKELGIYDLFDEILGIDNIYASSKLPIGLNFIKDKNKDDCLMIGDTSHDSMVAKDMGIECILIANGHESYERLIKTGVKILKDIKEVKL